MKIMGITVLSAWICFLEIELSWYNFFDLMFDNSYLHTVDSVDLTITTIFFFSPEGWLAVNIASKSRFVCSSIPFQESRINGLDFVEIIHVIEK